jgi:hypothetical protein
MKTLIAILCVICLCCADGSNAAETQALSIAIAVPQREIDASGKLQRPIVAFDQHSHFSVVITNLSDKPQRIVDDSNSWGDRALRFELTDSTGKSWQAGRVLHTYSKNVLHWAVLQPHECLVRDVYFADSEQWQGFPKPLRYGDSQTLTMRAVFEVASSEINLETGCWTGKVESEAASYEFNWRMSGLEPSRGIGIVAEAGKSFGQVSVNLKNQGPDANQTLESLTVSSNGQELKIPAGALAGVKRSLPDTLSVSVEPDRAGHDVLYVSFELGKPNSTVNQSDYIGLNSSPQRMYFSFQEGKFLKRFIVEKVNKIIEE